MRTSPGARVDLRADAVVFVVRERARAEHRDDLVGILLRLREHEGERMEERHLRRVERVALREQRRRADVAGEHVGAADRVERTAERLRDRRLDEPSCSPMRNSRSEDLHDVAHALRDRACRSSATRMFFFSIAPGVAARRSKYSPSFRQSRRSRAGSIAKQLRRRVAGDRRTSTTAPRPHPPLRPVDFDERVADRGAADAGRALVLRGNGEPEKKTTARSSDASSSVTR